MSEYIDSHATFHMIDRFERILADIRETKVDDSVCGMCEYDGAYIGQSGYWCNECPGFDKDNCFKLSDRCRKRWMGDITLPSAQQWIPCSERLPEEEGEYLVTLDFSWGKEIEMGDWLNGEWVNPNSHVTVAWAELPKPWKESEE